MSKNTTNDRFNPHPALGKQESNPGGLEGENVRGEIAACPTGLTDPLPAQEPQQEGGGGAPSTGAVDVSVPVAPGEGISEKQAERAEK